jgi:hypothetical protein
MDRSVTHSLLGSWMYMLFGFEDLIPSNLEFQFLIMLVQTNVLVWLS